MDTTVNDQLQYNPFTLLFTRRSTNLNSLISTLKTLITSLEKAKKETELNPLYHDLAIFFTAMADIVSNLQLYLENNNNNYSITKIGYFLSQIPSYFPLFDPSKDCSFWSKLKLLKSEMRPDRYNQHFERAELSAKDYFEYLTGVLGPWIEKCVSNKGQQKFGNKEISQLTSLFGQFETKTAQLLIGSSNIGRYYAEISVRKEELFKKKKYLEPINSDIFIKMANQYYYPYNERKDPTKTYYPDNSLDAAINISDFRDIIKNLMLAEVRAKSYMSAQGIIVREESKIYKPENINKRVYESAVKSYEYVREFRQRIEKIWQAYINNDQAAMAALLPTVPDGTEKSMKQWKVLGTSTGKVAYAGVGWEKHQNPLYSPDYERRRPSHIWNGRSESHPDYILEHYQDYVGRLIKIMTRGYSPSPRADFRICHSHVDHVFFYDKSHFAYGGHMALIAWPCDGYCVFQDEISNEMVIVTTRPIPPNKLMLIVRDPDLIPYLTKAGIPFQDWTSTYNKSAPNSNLTYKMDRSPRNKKVVRKF